jgi:hypothetical protein
MEEPQKHHGFSGSSNGTRYCRLKKAASFEKFSLPEN